MDGTTKSQKSTYQDFPGPTIDFRVAFPNLHTQLKDANVLITGGASGIGKACATEFLQHGAYVTIADLDTPMLSATREELSAVAEHKFQAVACNVTDWSSQLELFQSASKLCPKGVIDIVIPCASPRGSWFSFEAPNLDAGIGGSTSEIPTPPSTACVQVALIGMTYTCQLAVWYMARRKESLKCLLMISSMTAYRGIAGNGDYTAAKYGVRGLFKTLRDAPGNIENEDGPSVRINMLCPGYVKTPMTERSIEKVLAGGARLASMEMLLEGVLRISADQSIHGKAVGVAPDGCFDIRDDIPGHNGLTAVNEQTWFSREKDINRPRLGIW